jgi:glyoxylase-like metal-dependent hydrolase (beta-lactamase superfamily II)
VIEHVKTLVPNKPIRYAVNSHAHFDHAGGVRAAVAEGATVVTMAGNVPYFQGVFGTPNALRPDRMAQAGKPARLQGVQGDKGTLSDGTRTIELHKISGGPHSETMLMAYLPKERLLIEADAYTPLPPNTPPPATPNANNVNLIDNIERLKLQIDRILPLHGRVVPLAELYTTAGRQQPAR